MEALVVLVGAFAGAGLPLNASHHLSENDEIDNQWGCQQRVLAHVEETDGLVAAHENFRVILVQSSLVVANGWHVLDHNGVIWMLSLLVQDVVGSNHIIHDIRLGDLLGAKLLLRAQILAVVVAEMVVARNGGQLDASIDEKVDQSRLHLRLARLEIISTDEGSVLLGQLNCTGNKSVLRRSIDERGVLECACNGEDGRWGDFFVAGFDRLHQVLGCVVDARNDICESLSVSSPQDNDFVEAILSLEISKIQLAKI